MQPADPNARFLASFLDYLKVEKGLARSALRAYRSDLEQYAQFLLKHKRGLRDARRQDVRDFLNSLFPTASMAAAWRASSRRCVTSISTCCSTATSTKIRRSIIDTPRQWKVLPKSLAPSEVEQVLQGPPRAQATIGSRRR